MNFQERFPSDDDIWSYSNPTVAQQNAFKKYGKTAILYRSKAKNKKYSILHPNGKIVNFGDIRYEDFTSASSFLIESTETCSPSLKPKPLLLETNDWMFVPI